MHPKLSPVPRVFYPTREWKRAFAFLLFFMGSLWPLIIVSIVELTLWTTHLFGPVVNVLLGLGIYLVYLLIGYFTFSLFTKPIRHTITSEGITFCSPGYRIYTPWNNIRGVGQIQYGLYRPQALLLQERAVKGTVRDGSWLERATVERHWPISKKDTPDDAIPLLFTVPKNWQESELGRLIQEYASGI